MQSNNVLIIYFVFLIQYYIIVLFHITTVNGCAIRHSVSRPRFNYSFPYCWIFRLFLIFKAVMNILENIGFSPPFGLFPWNKCILRSGNTGSKFMNTFMALETCCQIASKKVQFQNTLKALLGKYERCRSGMGVPIPGNSMCEGALTSTDLCDLSLECHNMTTMQNSMVDHTVTDLRSRFTQSALQSQTSYLKCLSLRILI